MPSKSAALPFLIRPRRFGDQRGWFSEVFNERQMSSFGISFHFVQDNHSYSRQAGTLRGLHFQRPPTAQAKLVRVLRGRIFDVIVDVRQGSPTHGKFVTTTLTSEGGEQLYVPVGFAHGFCTLEDHVEVFYKVSDFYTPQDEGGVVWNDPDLDVPWPLKATEISKKDAVLPRFRDQEFPFVYEGEPLGPLIELT